MTRHQLEDPDFALYLGDPAVVFKSNNIIMTVVCIVPDFLFAFWEGVVGDEHFEDTDIINDQHDLRMALEKIGYARRGFDYGAWFNAIAEYTSGRFGTWDGVWYE